jgi:hypothetical protein
MNLTSLEPNRIRCLLKKINFFKRLFDDTACVTKKTLGKSATLYKIMTTLGLSPPGRGTFAISNTRKVKKVNVYLTFWRAVGLHHTCFDDIKTT